MEKLIEKKQKNLRTPNLSAFILLINQLPGLKISTCFFRLRYLHLKKKKTLAFAFSFIFPDCIYLSAFLFLFFLSGCFIS